jgi:hypothetical protein
VQRQPLGGGRRLHEVQTAGNDKDILPCCRRRMLHIAGNDATVSLRPAALRHVLM